MMNRLLENGQLQEMSCGSNFAYVVTDHTSFLPTEYKVLQSQGSNSFIKCMKMLFNGKVQLYYLTEGYRPLSSLLPRIDAENFMVVVSNILADVLEVKSNGFLYCANIDISFEKIFVDPTTYKVKLVYLPLKNRLFDDISAFENELRTSLVKIVSGISTLSSSKTIQLAAYLQDGTLSMESLHSKVKGGSVTEYGAAKRNPVNTATNACMRIVALNAPMRVDIEITKDEFTLGKKQGLVDGVISFNKMISRSHCKIVRSGQQFAIVDLQSQNGTFVNKVRLQPNRPCNIKNGDIVRMANSDFQVIIE